jgi:hypothetical protein
MRMLKTVIPALLALTLLGLVAAPTVAQTETPLGFDEIDGLEHAYARGFTADLSAMTDSSTPGATPDGWFALTTMVLAFDSEDHAADAVDLLVDEVVNSGFAGDGTMEETELDVDFDHVARVAVQEVEGLTTTALVALAQDGAFIHIVVGVTFGEDPAPVVASVLTDMAAAEVGQDDEIFREDGTSEGGLWAIMPSAEEVMAGTPALVEVSDETMYPEISGRAISTPARVERPAVTVSTPAD